MYSNYYVKNNSLDTRSVESVFYQLPIKDSSANGFYNGNPETLILKDKMVPVGVLIRDEIPSDEECKTALYFQSALGCEFPLIKTQKEGTIAIINNDNNVLDDKVKVVLLGQDPYHNIGQAHGLCFSVPDGTVPQNSTSATLKAKRLGIVGSRIGGFDLMGGCVWEPHHANHGTLPCAVTRSTIRGSFRLYGSRWVPPQICGHSRIMI